MSGCHQLAPIHVIGGGLAGSEAAWQIARHGIAAVLHEMRPARWTPAHHTDGLAELVCSNSFRADDPQTSAIGILHREMRQPDKAGPSACARSILISSCCPTHEPSLEIVPCNGHDELSSGCKV
jgi:tRNA:m(5)U-54 methyltransferase